MPPLQPSPGYARVLLFMIVLGAACGPAPGAAPRTGGGPEEGPGQESVEGGAVRELFDGRSLAGWEGDPRYWSVEEGVLVGRSTTDTPLERTTYLIWRGGEVADFELELEFQLEGTPASHPFVNSGVQFRGRELGRFSIAGYQADLAHEPGRTGTLYEQFGTRQLMARLGEQVSISADGKKELVRFADEDDFRSGEGESGWRRLRIRAVGPRIEIAVDGKSTVRVTDRHRLFSSTSGKLALQLHSGPPQLVRFRHIRLRELGGEADRRPRVDPQWIWLGDDPTAGEEAWFRREFQVSGEVQRALLWGMADDALEVYLNGELIASAEGYERMLIVEPLAIRQGKNVLAAWVQNDTGEAGLFLSLRVRQPSGLTHIGTAPDFGVFDHEVSGWNLMEAPAEPARSAVSFGPLGTEPWGVPPARLVNPRVRALGGERVAVPEGYRCELVYSVPRARQGSWVALAFDDRGRAIASDENGGLYRVELAGEGGVGVVGLPLAEGLSIGGAQGLCHAFDALYVSVSSDGESGLFRLRDTDGDDRFDELERLRAFDGGGEHGPHAVLAGPDEKLYVFAGDEVPLPERARESFGPSLLPAGLLPPRIFVPEGREGERVLAGRAGWVVRCKPDGSELELFVHGLRNAYDGAFDAQGELFTFDSDMEWDLGLPWYRPSRVYHLVHGADYGARYGTGKWPYSFGDTLPPALELGRTSPTGMLAGHRLLLGPRYGRALFAGDWLNGRILALFPGSEGASYRVESEVFAEGQPLQVTDLAAGPDGALYFTTGGRSTQSGLYRIVADAPGPPAPTPVDPARVTRPGAGSDDAVLRAALGSADRFLRHAARFVLEQEGRLDFDPGTELRARRELLLARVRTAPPEELDEVADALEQVETAGLDEEGLSWFLRTSSLVLQRRPELGLERRILWSERLLALFPTATTLLDREVAALLVELRSEVFVPLAVARLAREELTEAFYYAFLLRDLDVGWNDELHAEYFRYLNRASLELKGGLDVSLLLSRVRRAATARLDKEERSKLGPRLIPPVDTGTGTAQVHAREFVREWTLEELQALLPGLAEPRDLVRGAEVYREASCATCHVSRGIGVHRAPELSSVAARFSAEDLLEAIVEPSRVIAEQYRSSTFFLLDDSVQVGRILREGPAGVMLIHDAPPYDAVFLLAEEIEERRESDLSSMPSGLLNTHGESDVLDLLAYLLDL